MEDVDDLLQEVEPEEQDLDKIIQTFLEPKNIYHLTELTGDEVTAFSTLYSMAAKYNIELLKEWLYHNLMLRVSKSRKGRSEFVKITQRHAEQEMQEKARWHNFRRE